MDPIERLITCYALEEDGRYGKLEVHQMRAETRLKVLPGIDIQGDGLVQRWPEIDY